MKNTPCLWRRRISFIKMSTLSKEIDRLNMSSNNKSLENRKTILKYKWTYKKTHIAVCYGC